MPLYFPYNDDRVVFLLSGREESNLRKTHIPSIFLYAKDFCSGHLLLDG